MSQPGDHELPTLPAYPPQFHPKTSDLLRHLLDGLTGDKVSVGWVVERLGSRSFGVIILLMGLPNVIPQIPGVSTIFGLLIMLPAIQLVLGLRQMWLPSYLANIMLPSAKVAGAVTLAIPWVSKFEKVIKPRLTVLTYPPMENLVGALVLLLGFILFLPIPGGNWLPAIACCFFALGILERDGFFTLVGLGAAVISLLAVGAIVIGFWHLIDEFFYSATGLVSGVGVTWIGGSEQLLAILGRPRRRNARPAPPADDASAGSAGESRWRRSGVRPGRP